MNLTPGRFVPHSFRPQTSGRFVPGKSTKINKYKDVSFRVLEVVCKAGITPDQMIESSRDISAAILFGTNRLFLQFNGYKLIIL